MTSLDWLESIILGIIQGLTEFLPISSDGHLALGQALFESLRGTDRSGSDKILLDIILHLGTLVAVLIYYRAWFRPLWASSKNPVAEPATVPTQGLIHSEYVPRTFADFLHVSLLAIVATVPTVGVVLVLKKAFEAAHDSLLIDALGFWFTALILFLCQKMPGGTKTRTTMTWKDAFLIGLAQGFAPLPGVSRSGLTVATALARGLQPAWAAIFSLWMSIPAITGALLMEVKDLLETPPHDGNLVTMGLVGAVVSGVVGYGAIVWLVKIVQARRLNLFAWYLVGLGAIVLAWSAVRG